MSRDFTPRELYSFGQFLEETENRSLLDVLKGTKVVNDGKTEDFCPDEYIALCDLYPSLAILYNNFCSLHSCLSEVRGGLELLAQKEAELSAYLSSGKGDKNSYLVKWFEGVLTPNFYYSEENDRLFFDAVVEEAKTFVLTNSIRYRTEAFGGSGERDAAEVLAYEGFELGNADAFEGIIRLLPENSPLIEKANGFIRELGDNGFVDDMFTEDKVQFFRDALSEIGQKTGVNVNYALWLADMDILADESSLYGKYINSPDDIDSYEVGPIVLIDLGQEGSLYGYPHLHWAIEDQVVELQFQLNDVTFEQETSELSAEREAELDKRFDELSHALEPLKTILEIKEDEFKKVRAELHQEVEKGLVPFADKLSDAETRAGDDRSGGKVVSKSKEEGR